MYMADLNSTPQCDDNTSIQLAILTNTQYPCTCLNIAIVCNLNYVYILPAIDCDYNSAIVLKKEPNNDSNLNSSINRKIRDQNKDDLGSRSVPNEHQGELNVIRINNPNNAKACCMRMFEYWLQVNTTASWQKS